MVPPDPEVHSLRRVNIVAAATSVVGASKSGVRAGLDLELHGAPVGTGERSGRRMGRGGSPGSPGIRPGPRLESSPLESSLGSEKTVPVLAGTGLASRAVSTAMEPIRIRQVGRSPGSPGYRPAPAWGAVASVRRQCRGPDRTGRGAGQREVAWDIRSRKARAQPEDNAPITGWWRQRRTRDPSLARLPSGPNGPRAFRFISSKTSLCPPTALGLAVAVSLYTPKEHPSACETRGI